VIRIEPGWHGQARRVTHANALWLDGGRRHVFVGVIVPYEDMAAPGMSWFGLRSVFTPGLAMPPEAL